VKKEETNHIISDSNKIIKPSGNVPVLNKNNEKNIKAS
jgi:ribosomal protein L36